MAEQREQAAGDRAADQQEIEEADPAANQHEIEESDPAANQQEIEGADPTLEAFRNNPVPQVIYKRIADVFRRVDDTAVGADPILQPLMLETFRNKPVPPVIYNIANAFQQVVDRGDTAVAQNQNLYYRTVFHCSSYTDISMEKYLIYINNLVECSNSCYVLAYSYLDRLANRPLQPPITSRNAHRILLTAVRLAIKFHDNGEGYNNRYFALVGQVSLRDMDKMVLALLFALEYKLHLPNNEFLSHKAFPGRYNDDDHYNCCGCIPM